ncbi:MAG: NADH-quinone oxidoreductase subunit L, partial [Hymenobacteraceae bacterium]|nr:NADH-quinone oxidoreductase subunit L [Hymenobacteraceae bacterium]
RPLLVLVPLVALPVMIYAARYLRADARYATFFGLLSLFVAAMLGLVLARDLLALTLCWELVGFTSYLLIGFWFEKPAAASGARSAFLLNRLGDLGLFVALGALLAANRAPGAGLDLPSLIAGRAFFATHHSGLLALAGGGFALAAIAKSAQFPLTSWLPRAMAGPTPVSALLHAATLVAAGAYLLARTYPLLAPAVLTGLAVVGAITSVWAAVAALGQTDLKKVLAYSTASQLGYVFLALGTGSPVAAVLHLIAHAFFKASLFLNAGIVTHAVAHAATGDLDPQDLRQLGGLRRALPLTFGAYCVAAAALIGLPLTTGFLTKEAVLTGAVAWAAARAPGFGWAWLVPDAALLTVLLTALYVARHGRLIFLSTARGAFDAARVRESSRREAPAALLVPVLGLAALALWVWLAPANPLHIPTKPGTLAQTLSFPAATRWLSAGPAWLTGTSLALIGGGLVLGLRGAGPATGWAWARYPEATLGRFWTETAPRAAYALARAVARFDERGLDRFVLRFGKGFVITAKLTGWFDHWVVDRLLVHGSARGLAWLGHRLTTAPDAGVQTYYRWLVAAGLAAGAWGWWG